MIVSKEINYIVLFKWAVFIPLFTIAGSLMNKNVIYFSLIAIGMVQSMIVIMQQIGVFASHNPFFPIIGFMGNPGIMGGFQAIAMTACIVYLKKTPDCHSDEYMYCVHRLVNHCLRLQSGIDCGRIRFYLAL